MIRTMYTHGLMLLQAKPHYVTDLFLPASQIMEPPINKVLLNAGLKKIHLSAGHDQWIFLLGE